jgi:O-antigen/teichoic acid export membrane protein
MTLFAILAPQLVRLLLGPKWLPSVPFLQMYCFVYALLPIHTTNLQVLNGMGRSDLFLKLEVIKKCLGLAIISFAAFVMRDIYAIVFGSVVVGIVSTFINASPNKRVIGYSYMEQVRDIVPAFAMSVASAVAVWFAASAMPNDVLGILVGIVVMLLVYVLLSWAFHVEEFDYVVRNLRAARSRRTAGK